MKLAVCWLCVFCAPRWRVTENGLEFFNSTMVQLEEDVRRTLVFSFESIAIEGHVQGLVF